jgi:hypothetical protein
MRQTFHKRTDDLTALRKVLLKEIISGTLTVKDALTQMGAKYAAWIKYEIDNGEFAPNAPSTIARKGEGKHPLFDTGKMRGAVNFEVTKGS